MSDLFPGRSIGHAPLVSRAIRWLRTFHKCGVVFGEMTAAVPYYPDALGWHAGFSILVECKASRSDFFADRKKGIHDRPDDFPGEERWYLTPPGLVKPEEVPAGWFLAEAMQKGVRIITRPEMGAGWRDHPENARNTYTWTRLRNRERAAAGVPYLLSAVRRHELGIRWLDSEARFESDFRAKRRIADAPMIAIGRMAPRVEPAQGCHGGSDGDCYWSGCPQLRDNEPETSGRHCPLDREDDSV